MTSSAETSPVTVALVDELPGGHAACMEVHADCTIAVWLNEQHPDTPALTYAFTGAGTPSVEDLERGRQVAAWFTTRLERLRDVGPEPDGWRLEVIDGAEVYRLYGPVREVELPPDPFDD